MSVMFKAIKDKMTLIKDREPQEIPFEVRTDPLTGTTARVFDLPYRPPESPNTEETFKRSEGIFCPFCPGNIENSTPFFPGGLIPGGRIKVGDATVIPNILPLDRYVAVVVMSPSHFVRMEDFNPGMMKDAFLAAQEFILRAAEYDREVTSLSINWNYMPPAGSSLVHPHLQVLCGERPTNHMRRELQGAERYFRDNGREFWGDFIREEKDRAERLLGDTGHTFWTVGFAPRSHIPDVLCVFPEEKSLLGLGKGAMDSFLEGLSAVLSYYRGLGLFSFNVSVLSFREEEHFRVNARIQPRLVLRDIGNSDYTFLQAVHKEHTSIRPPESVCRGILEQGDPPFGA